MRSLILALCLFCGASEAGETKAYIYGRGGQNTGSIRTDSNGNVRIYNRNYQKVETWRRTGSSYYRYDKNGKYIGRVTK